MSTEITDRQTFKRLFAYVKPYRWQFVLSIIAMIGYSLVDAAFIGFIQPLIDNGFGHADSPVLKWAPLFVIAAFFLRGFFNFSSTYGLNWIGGQVVMHLRQQVFEHLLRMPVPYYDQNSTGKLISRVTYDCGLVFDSASKTLVKLVQEGALIIGLLCVMFYHSWQLSLVFLVIGPVVAVVVTQIAKRFRKLSRQIQAAMGDVTSAAEQMVNGHKVVLAFGGQQVEAERFRQVSNRSRSKNMKMQAAQAMATPVIQIIASFALAAVLFIASFPSMVENLTAGAFTSILTSMAMLLRPLKQLTSVYGEFQRGMTAASTIFELLDEPSEQDSGSHDPGRVKGDVVYRDVTFTYPTKQTPALAGINLQIPAGKTVALVGRSGGGKSTITHLLSRLYELDSGQILIDGRDIRDYSLAALRRQVAVVSQHVTLFDDSIANNIAYALAEPPSRERLREVARMAHALEFIEALPQGFDTLVGQNGVMLSGGQRQRIAIARALLRDTPILILDEATSALDTEAERHIQAALETLRQNRTSLVIAHRLSTIENADHIVVINDGRIVEQGNHAELLARDGAYAQLHRLQFGD
ncbi:MAG: lipid A export permease/ATP-binding protein MsbA [Gammaproteobacteria bacterium]|nr:lipid A export permease/ATP-binding protein MsbA [Gammaproteobacteria bacterium]